MDVVDGFQVIDELDDVSVAVAPRIG